MSTADELAHPPLLLHAATVRAVAAFAESSLRDVAASSGETIGAAAAHRALDEFRAKIDALLAPIGRHGDGWVPCIDAAQGKEGSKEAKDTQEGASAVEHRLGCGMASTGGGSAAATSSSSQQSCSPPPGSHGNDAGSGLLGKRVSIHSLSGRVDLNGRVGVADSFDEEARRYAVRLVDSGEVVKVRPTNLTVIDDIL